MNQPAPSKKQYAGVWFALVVFHFTILGLAMLNLRFVTPIILALAVIQTILIMLVFMEVRHGGKLLRLFALAGFFWLLIQFTLVASDYLTRNWH